MASEKNGKNVEIYVIPTSEPPSEKRADSRKKFWNIDREMLRFKVHYFLLAGAFGSCMPYLAILAKKRVGITATGIAAILTAQRCIFIFIKPAIGYLADYFNKLKIIICVLTVITTVFAFVILAVPKIEKTRTINQIEYKSLHYELLNSSDAYVVCEFQEYYMIQSNQDLSFNNSQNNDLRFQFLHDLSKFLDKCSGNINTTEKSKNGEYTLVLEQKLDVISPSSNSVSCKTCCKLTEKCQRIDLADPKASTMPIFNDNRGKSDFQRYQFWLYALIATICQAAANNMFTLTDTACCESVQKTGAQIGRQFLWGNIGWGLMCPIGGLLNDYTGDFVASWILMAVMAFISLLNMTKLKIANPAFSQNLLKDIGIVLSSKELLAFMFCVILNGVGIGIIWFYVLLFVTDIGGSRFLCGMVMFVQNFVGGIPFMFFAGWVIKKIGHFNILTLSLLAYSIRFFWYSRLHNPWLILPIEVLNGFSEGLLYTGVASFAKLSAKPGTEATTQSLLFTAHEGIGSGIGCIAVGLGFDSIGGHRTFRYLSIYAGCAMVLSIILHLFVRKQKRDFNVTPKIT